MANPSISKLAERLMTVLANHKATHHHGCGALAMALALSMMSAGSTRKEAIEAFGKTWDLLARYGGEPERKFDA